MTDGYVTSTMVSGRTFAVRHLPLLDQLAEAIEPSGGIGADGRRIPASAPPARIDALDRYMAINSSVAVRLAASGVRLVPDLKVNMRRLVGVSWTVYELRSLDRDTVRWLTWCRVLTGWESPPFIPNAKCPACGMRGTLRVRLDRRTACWVEPGCDAVWTSSMIDALADHIRAVNEQIVLA
jgi:hypothetical protein